MAVLSGLGGQKRLVNRAELAWHRNFGARCLIVPLHDWFVWYHPGWTSSMRLKWTFVIPAPESLDVFPVWSNT